MYEKPAPALLAVFTLLPCKSYRNKYQEAGQDMALCITDNA